MAGPNKQVPAPLAPLAGAPVEEVKPVTPVDQEALDAVKVGTKIFVEPVHGDMFDPESNTHIRRTEKASGTRVPHGGWLKSQIEAGKLRQVD